MSSPRFSSCGKIYLTGGPTPDSVNKKHHFRHLSLECFLVSPFPLRKCLNINIKIIIEKEFFLMSLRSYNNNIKLGLLLLVNEILLKLNQLQVN